MIHHRRRADDPRIDAPSVPPLFRAKDRGFLLRLADEQHPFVTGEAGKVLLRDLVFALPLLERHEVDALGSGEPFDRVDESLTHGRNHHGRGHPHAELRFDEVDETGAGLERRHVRVEIHAVDRFQFERHVVVEDFSNDFVYHRLGAPGERGPLLYDDSVACLQAMVVRWRRGTPAAIEVTVREV